MKVCVVRYILKVFHHITSQVQELMSHLLASEVLEITHTHCTHTHTHKHHFNFISTYFFT